MRDRSSLHHGRSHVLQLRDRFYYHGSDGKHLCLVTDRLAEEDLHSSAMGKVSNASGPPVTYHPTTYIDYLHNECNNIHAGWSNNYPSRNTSYIYIHQANILMAASDDVLSLQALVTRPLEWTPTVIISCASGLVQLPILSRVET